MKPKINPIWNYFALESKDTAKCKICNKVYSRRGGSTTPLKSHLKSMHSDSYEEFCQLERQQNEEKAQVQSSSSKTPLQEAKKQMTLEESFSSNQKWESSNKKSTEMDKLIAEMLALQDLPFNFVDHIGFRRVMKGALPKYALRGRQFFSDHICEEIYPKMSKKIKALLNDFEKVSFTTDIWSDPSANVSLLSLTAHGITQDFRRLQVILKCEPLDGHHTGDIIAEKFQKMLTEWQIPASSVHCMIRDGGSNMKRAMNLANIQHVDCAVHQIQLCIRHALDAEENIKDLIAKCKKIATHFNHSLLAQHELTKIQKEQLHQPALGVIQDCPTRWNSTYYAMERLLKIKDSLCLYTSKHNIPQITPEEWLQIDTIVSILKPFEETTKEMSSRTATISSVIPIIHALKSTLESEINKQGEHEILNNFTNKLSMELNIRFGNLKTKTVYALATYLDPRYKLKFFNDITREEIQSDLLTLIDSAKSNETDTSQPPQKRRRNEESDITNSSKIQSVLANILTTNSDEEEEIAGTDTLDRFGFLKSLIAEYNKEKRLSVDENPLIWWKMHTKYEKLNATVRQFLSPPPSSVASEQLFSGAGLIYDPLRNRLDAEKAAILLFVKFNLPLINFEY